ncbi:MAG: hypothetical protein CM15mP83_1740 [Flavobacteriaceae bacterium]|nr:MAG: hypothetical protein CM15mP83_1740 [Flavobacteriaceae bacterium]
MNLSLATQLRMILNESLKKFRVCNLSGISTIGFAQPTRLIMCAKVEEKGEKQLLS